jgi:hypothetical protein
MKVRDHYDKVSQPLADGAEKCADAIDALLTHARKP